MLLDDLGWNTELGAVQFFGVGAMVHRAGGIGLSGFN